MAAAPARPKSWDVDSYPYFQNPGGKSTDLIEGWDPYGSGTRVTVTRLAVEKMSIEDFKRFSRVTVQSRPEWQLIEDREKMPEEILRHERVRS